MKLRPLGSLAKANTITITNAQMIFKVAGKQERHGFHGSGDSGRLEGILARAEAATGFRGVGAAKNV